MEAKNLEFVTSYQLERQQWMGQEPRISLEIPSQWGAGVNRAIRDSIAVPPNFLRVQHPNRIKAAVIHVDCSGDIEEEWERVAQEAIENLARTELEKSGAIAAFVLPHLSASLRQSVAANPHTPSRLLEPLAQDESFEVRVAIAQHPNTPRRILEQLVRDSALPIREQAAQRIANLGSALIDDDTLPESLRHLFAEFPDRWEILLAQLARQWDTSTRYWVATIAQTPVDLLEQLAQDPSQDVRRAVAVNSNLPQILLERLLSDPVLRVSQAARDVLVTHGLNGSLLSLALAYHARNTQSPLVRFAALAHPQIPPHVWVAFLTSTVWLERYAIARNPQTLPEPLTVLAGDPHPIVRAAAQAR